jgi:peptidoglycan hydrolase-like protein with peptidoglycan-binding domain
MNIKRIAVAGLVAGALGLGGMSLAAGPASADTASHLPGHDEYFPVLRQGETSEEVRALQWLLNCKGIRVAVPSHFGPRTYAAVRTYQYRHGLYADGNVGAATWTDLLSRSQVRYGDTNDCVKAAQVLLNKYAGHYHLADLPISGYFGPRTLTLLHRVQADSHVPTSSIITVHTWSILLFPGD